MHLFKKRGKADPRNHRGITLLSAVGKASRDISKRRMGTLTENKYAKGKQGFG